MEVGFESLIEVERRSLIENRSGGIELHLFFNGEFDSGSERTLAAWIRHASRTLIRG